MQLFLVGVNHERTPLSIREGFAVSPDRIPAMLDHLLEQDGIEEAVLLSTCNRTELYCVAETTSLAALKRWFNELGGRDTQNDMSEFRYIHRNEVATRHLLRVTAGLDSLVIGEAQIQGQVKQAYQMAHQAACVGPYLHQLFQYVISAAKEIRNSTALSSTVSVPYAATKVAQRKLGSLTDKIALLIGAGETIETLAFHLHKRGIGSLLIANRTLVRAQTIADRFRGTAVPLSEASHYLPHVDLVATATASESALLSSRDFEKRNSGKTLLALDLGVPRDIAPEVSSLPNVALYSIDDFAHIISSNQAQRQAAVADAEHALEKAMHGWQAARRIRRVVPTICALRADATSARRKTMAEARRLLANGRDPQEVLEYLAETLTNRLIHQPTVKLREAAATGDREFLDVARELYGLSEDDQSDQQPTQAA